MRSHTNSRTVILLTLGSESLLDRKGGGGGCRDLWNEDLFGIKTLDKVLQLEKIEEKSHG